MTPLIAPYISTIRTSKFNKRKIYSIALYISTIRTSKFRKRKIYYTELIGQTFAVLQNQKLRKSDYNWGGD